MQRKLLARPFERSAPHQRGVPSVRALTAPVLQLGGRILDTILPPRCIITGDIVDTPGMVSPAAWKALTFIAPPWCDRCGVPFAYAAPDGGSDGYDDSDNGDNSNSDNSAHSERQLCARCLVSPPPFARARAALAYDDGCRSAILGFKHGDQLHAAETFALWMQRAGSEILTKADVLIPVPLHRWRLWQRRYNQSQVLAAALSGLSGVPCLPDALVRRRKTPPQKGLNREARRKNVAGAFLIHPGRIAAVTGKTVVLIDDVLTSGATIRECTKTLLRAGAARVDVLTLARVAKPS